MTSEPHEAPISAVPLTSQELRTFCESHEERLDDQAHTLAEQGTILRRVDSTSLRTAALCEILIARLEAWSDEEARNNVAFERRVRNIESRLARESADRELRVKAAEDAAKAAHVEALHANELAASTSRNQAITEAQARATLASQPDMTELAREARGFAVALTTEEKKGRVELGKAAMLLLGAIVGAVATLVGYLLKR